jgi:hypothetical protein
MLTRASALAHLSSIRPVHGMLHGMAMAKPQVSVLLSRDPVERPHLLWELWVVSRIMHPVAREDKTDSIQK